MGKHEAVDLLVHDQDTATPPATAFVTTPPLYRISPPESVDKDHTCQGHSHRPLCLLSSSSHHVLSQILTYPLLKIFHSLPNTVPSTLLPISSIFCFSFPAHSHLLTLRSPSPAVPSPLHSRPATNPPPTHCVHFSRERRGENQLVERKVIDHQTPVGKSMIGNHVLPFPHTRLIGPFRSRPVSAIHHGHYTDVPMRR